MSVFFQEHIILLPFISFIIVSTIKALFLIRKKEFSISGALAPGGMPSGHSAIVMSVATAMGIKYGITGDEFVISIVFSTIIIYDALNLRFQSGLHAKAINEITNPKNKLNESMWHLPSEVFVGSLIGMLVSALTLISF